MAKSYAVVIDILKRLPDNSTSTIAQMEKDGETNFPGSEKGATHIKDDVMPQLEKLMKDEDVDVRYFATTAARAWTESEGAAGSMET